MLYCIDGSYQMREGYSELVYTIGRWYKVTRIQNRYGNDKMVDDIVLITCDENGSSYAFALFENEYDKTYKYYKKYFVTLSEYRSLKIKKLVSISV